MLFRSGVGAAGSSPRLRIRTTICGGLGVSLVGEAYLRAGLAGGERRPAAGALGGDDARGAILGAGEVAAGSAAILGGGEAALAWRRRRGLMGEAAKAWRWLVLASASWDLSTAVAMGGDLTLTREDWRFVERKQWEISRYPRAALYRRRTGPGRGRKRARCAYLVAVINK